MQPYFQQNGISIYHGNCVEILPALNLVDVDAIITDPPYNVSHRNGQAKTTVGRVPRKDGTTREIRRDFGKWDHDWKPEPFLKLVGPILKDGGSLVAFTSEFLFDPYLHTGLDHRSLLYWRKNNPAPNFRKQIVRAIEMAVWQTRGGVDIQRRRLSPQHLGLPDRRRLFNPKHKRETLASDAETGKVDARVGRTVHERRRFSDRPVRRQRNNGKGLQGSQSAMRRDRDRRTVLRDFSATIELSASIDSPSAPRK